MNNVAAIRGGLPTLIGLSLFFWWTRLAGSPFDGFYNESTVNFFGWLCTACAIAGSLALAMNRQEKYTPTGEAQCASHKAGVHQAPTRSLEGKAAQAAKELGIVLAVGGELEPSDVPIIRRRLEEVVFATNAAITAIEQKGTAL